MKQATIRARELRAITPDLAAALEDRGVIVLRRAELVMVALVTTLMIAKPF